MSAPPSSNWCLPYAARHEVTESDGAQLGAELAGGATEGASPVLAMRRRWGRRGAARQRSTAVNHGAPRTTKPTARQP
jgi:hypothetical protein